MKFGEKIYLEEVEMATCAKSSPNIVLAYQASALLVAHEEATRLKYEKEAMNSLGHERIEKAENERDKLREEVENLKVLLAFPQTKKESDLKASLDLSETKQYEILEFMFKIKEIVHEQFCYSEHHTLCDAISGFIITTQQELLKED